MAKAIQPIRAEAQTTVPNPAQGPSHTKAQRRSGKNRCAVQKIRFLTMKEGGEKIGERRTTLKLAARTPSLQPIEAIFLKDRHLRIGIKKMYL